MIWCYQYQTKKSSKHKELSEIEKKKNHDKCEISYKDTETLNKYRTKNRGSNCKYKKRVFNERINLFDEDSKAIQWRKDSHPVNSTETTKYHRQKYEIWLILHIMYQH